MILYQGKILQNSRQEALIESLKDDVAIPLLHKEALSAAAVINACDKLAQRVLSGDFDNIVKPFLRLFNISNEQFEELVRLFTKESLSYKCSIELCDDERTIDNKVIRKRYPLGVLLHIAAGNVDVLPAYSVVEGLLSGNVNILKLPMGDSGLSVRLLYELITIEPLLSDYIYVFDVPSTETETLKKLADLMLQGPMPEEDDGFDFTEEDIQALTGEKIDSILLEKYGIYPTYHARLVYLMMRRALAGDRTMLFALFSISSYDELVPQILYTSSKVINR